MRILVSNDDGYQAPGLRALVRALKEIAEVVVVAPDQDRSGASNSLTLKRPLYITRHDDGVISVDGTPTDCVHLAATGLFDEPPHMVVSGINAGPNMGDDVLYSGTVAAATEGRHLGLPAVAVSLASRRPEHYDTAARVARRLVVALTESPLPADTILNVNVPDLPWDELAGFHATRLGHRHQAEPVIKDTDPRGNAIYWVGPPGPEQDAGPGTDFHAVRTGHVSITPIQVDLTRYTALDQIASWVESL